MLSLAEYARYSRQLLLAPPAFHGTDSQLRLRAARVLVVGAGGLGCPALTFLAAAGVGHITIADDDAVEHSNLARQFLHTDAGAAHALNKAESAAHAARRINPLIDVHARAERLTPANALALVRAADVVLDCSDNPLTRYLINDAAVLAHRPLVSAAAQGVEGQVVVLHKPLDARPHTDHRGPCYRCLFPRAPRPEEVQTCSDGGVLGVVTGLVGTLQALEAIKLIARIGEDPFAPPTLLLVAPLSVSTPPFRTIKLRPRRASTCRACADPALALPSRITTLEHEDYLSFCGLTRDDSAADAAIRHVAIKNFAAQHAAHKPPLPASSSPDLSRSTVVKPILHSPPVQDDSSAVPAAIPPARPAPASSPPAAATDTLPTEAPAPPIIDVRPPHEFHIAHLAGARNVPLARIRRAALQHRRERERQRAHAGAEAQQQHSTTTADLAPPSTSSAAASLRAELGLAPDPTPPEPHIEHSTTPSPQHIDVHVLCRRGNDSREAVRLLHELFGPFALSGAEGSGMAASASERTDHPPIPDDDGSSGGPERRSPIHFLNVSGGLLAYASEIDPTFPVF